MALHMIHNANAEKTTLQKPILPNWIMGSAASLCLEEAAFTSGTVLSLLYVTMSDLNIGVPTKLLRQRLALKAAVNCLKIEGRIEEECVLRDAYLLTQTNKASSNGKKPQEILRGPSGDMLAMWSNACSISFRNKGWQDRLIDLLPEHIQKPALAWLDDIVEADTFGSPIARAANLLSSVLKAFPREEAIGLLLADVALSRALGWQHIIPLMALYMKRKPLLEIDIHEQLKLACYHATIKSAQEAIRLSHDLARRAERLKNIAAKLRAKGSNEAVQLFLTHDAVLPCSMLSPNIQGTNVQMSDRSARRFCDRLVALGVVREMTGRSTFRLYGI